MGFVRRKVDGILVGGGAIAAWFGRGTLETWFFDKVLKVIEPYPSWSLAIEYGPPALLTMIALWLLWSGRAQTPEQSTPVARSIAISPNGLISLKEAARLLYEAARSKGHLLASAAERMSGNNQGRMAPGTSEDVLDYMATYIAQEACLWGSRPPSEKREVIPPELSRFGAFKSGALVLKTDRDTFTDLLIDKNDLFKIVSNLGQIATETISMQPQVDAAEAQFERGYRKATARKTGTLKDGKLLLVTLKAEGVQIRNHPQTVSMMLTQELEEWISSITRWMEEVIKALKPFSDADAEWFKTLDTVPPARVPIPNIRLGGSDERARYTQAFGEHDRRLARLDELFKKYGIGG